MIIRSITIDNYGGIKHLSRQFSPGINHIRTEEADAVFGAIGRVFRSPVITIGFAGGPPVTEETRIRAEIDIDKERYTVIICGRLPSGDICYDVEGPGFHETDFDDRDKRKKITGARFYERIYRSFEEATLSTYHYSSKDPYSKRLAEYMDREDPEHSRELAEATDNIVNTSVFRRCLKQFIDGYQPEWIDQSRNIRTYLGKNGVFKHKREGERQSLSASEKVLADFLCFLKINAFWKSVEQIRDMNHVEWPLFIQNLAERVDQAIDLTYYLQQAEALGRQVFFAEA